MRDVLADYRDFRSRLALDQIAIATVVQTWGSSPRPLGSRMLVGADGSMAGSVSNGCIEGDVFEAAQEVLRTRAARRVEYGVADDLAFSVGLACGGHIEVFVQPANEVHDSAASALEDERPAELHTNVATGETFLLLREPARGEPAFEGDEFVEPLARPAHMVIVGAIHIAVPLHRLAKVMGYRVTVVDARAQFATRERFPEADEIVVEWPDTALGRIPIDRSTAVVVLTHDPKFDLPALRSVVGRGAGYVGAIGSRKTNANRMEALRAEGIDEAALAEVHGPIGLDLGGRSAEDTALAIMAEATAARHGATGGFMRDPGTASR